MKTIALLHPGNMGSTIGACAATSGARVLWASAQRSAASRKRAEQAGLVDAGDLAAAVRQSDIVLSVCPPEFATEIAAERRRATLSRDLCRCQRRVAGDGGRNCQDRYQSWRQLRRRRHHRLAGQASRHDAECISREKKPRRSLNCFPPACWMRAASAPSLAKPRR